jgi:dienelactone hydrolase
MKTRDSAAVQNLSAGEFAEQQRRRRQELWGLLGDLPAGYKGGAAQLARTDAHAGFRIERLKLDLNGVEAAPAWLLIPDRRPNPAPALLYLHAHFGTYEVGKDELLQGRAVMPAYATELAKRGIVTLALDSWCFGERRHDADGARGESDAFKLMLWQGRTLWGMMLWDELRALDYLLGRPEVDPSRVGVFGLSMGATKAWWLSALDERIKLCIDLCCLTDYGSLIEAGNLSGHGLYYYVPSLLKHFSAAQVNELIVPRARVSLNGRNDPLTPEAGVERIRGHVLPLYEKFGRREDCDIRVFDGGHGELPGMREIVLRAMERYLL